jgi:hypothetical protein
LKGFPFNKWDISIITVEHNFREDRIAIHDLMVTHGFVRILTELSMFDDWYVSKTLLPRFEEIFYLNRKQST